jgi:hypothetical protein
MTKDILNFFFLTVLILASPRLGLAGDLDEFEEAATQSNKAASETESGASGEFSEFQQNNDEESSLGEEIFGAIIGEFFKAFFLFGGVNSFERVGVHLAQGEMDPSGPIPLKRRNPGDFLLPILQIDLMGGILKNEIPQIKLRVETGFGPVGGQFYTTYFNEPETGDHLLLQSFSGIYRMSFGSNFTFGTGVGASRLLGNQDTWGVNFTFPFKLSVNQQLNSYYRPTFHLFAGTPTTENEIGIVYRFSKTSVTLFYNSNSAGSKTLRGLGVGYSYHY